ncbi:hypothetical protein RFI_26832 [Reticulomyxa filosa]|uniref:Uncharacterized protein n=1 Tax=Reticulomyxa filosa TaxID=46433 RepID=X6M963_RETFI|nr:hypothetical protein RFI_26832 [Reticulomyxa filosa]|eukprot:ETO10543.1 hypothetical protein RFI_26832 [Reticulomyxa filosa]
MDTVPLNTPHPKNGTLIQPYLVAYFKSNGLDIDKNKEWLKEYIKNATILKDSTINESITHLYCSGNNPPRIIKDWHIVQFKKMQKIVTYLIKLITMLSLMKKDPNTTEVRTE